MEEEEEIFQSPYAVYVRALGMLGTVISKVKVSHNRPR
jgi:hypothetical protein